MTETWRCPRCTMTFGAERPEYAQPSRFTITRCAAPGCGVRFAHTFGERKVGTGAPCRVWLEPFEPKPKPVPATPEPVPSPVAAKPQVDRYREGYAAGALWAAKALGETDRVQATDQHIFIKAKGSAA